MDEADLARFTEEVLITLASLTDWQGLKIVLPPQDQITVLASATAAVMNTRTDLKLFRPVRVAPDGKITFGG